MNGLFDSPVGALLARPWLDPVGLYGLRRWYLPLSRLWAAANLAGLHVARFREEIGIALPGFWSEARLQRLLARHGRARARADEMRTAWEAALFDPAAGGDPERLDCGRRTAATVHLASRAFFYPLLFPSRPTLARWRIDAPEQVERELGHALENPSTLHMAPIALESVAISRSFVKSGLREYWLRAPTPSARLRQRAGSEILYARVVEPVGGTIDTLIIGNGLCVEAELMSMDRGPGPQLAATGWRVIEPVSPYHGLRAMPGFHGDEPLIAASLTSSLDLFAGQAIESALGETDRWVPYRDGLALAQRWGLPEDNQFRYRFGHLGMPVQLTRDSSPFARLRQVMNGG